MCVGHMVCRVDRQCRARFALLRKEKVALETSLASTGTKRVTPAADKAVFFNLFCGALPKRQYWKERRLPPFFYLFVLQYWAFLQKVKGKATRAMDVSQLHFCPLLASPPVRCWCNDRHLLGRKFSGGPKIDVPQLIHKLRCAGSASCVTKGFP